MKNSVRRIIQKIKQFRLVGYVVIGIELYKIRGIEQTIPTLFLTILLTELSVYKTKPKPTQEDIDKELDKIVERGRD